MWDFFFFFFQMFSITKAFGPARVYIVDFQVCPLIYTMLGNIFSVIFLKDFWLHTVLNYYCMCYWILSASHMLMSLKNKVPLKLCRCISTMETQAISSQWGEHKEWTFVVYKQTNHFRWRSELQTESLGTFLHFHICAKPSHSVPWVKIKQLD